MDNRQVLISKKTLRERIKQLAAQIEKDYKGEKVTYVCILKGSLYFFADLTRRIDLESEVETIRVSSYQGEQSTGKIEFKLEPDNSVEGKNVIVIEDIIDTGYTLAYLKNYLKEQNPKSLKICTLLDKPDRRAADIDVDYVGFVIPDYFVFGYGMDVDERFRTLPKVYYFTNNTKDKIKEDAEAIKLQLVKKPKQKTE